MKKNEQMLLQVGKGSPRSLSGDIKENGME